MSIHDMIDAVVKCVKCGKGRRDCACYVKCPCGWLKDLGAHGCERCQAVQAQYEKVGPSTYRAMIGDVVIETSKIGIHWGYRIRFPDGGGDTHTGFGTNKTAKWYGAARAFELGARGSRG